MALPSLRITELFGLATWQGAAVHGKRQFGVPPGGAFDQESFVLANALIGKKPDTLVIELTMGAIKLEAMRSARVSIVGAACEVSVDGRSASCQVALSLLSGQSLSVAIPTKGARVYLAIATDNVNETIRAGHVLKTGAMLHGRQEDRITKTVTLSSPSSLSERQIRVISINGEEIPPAIVSIHSNRVGIRLEGPQLDPGLEMLSEPSCPGAIQVVNDGSLIIHGPDGPTVGGYRKIGVVCSADLDRLAQVRPRQELQFQTISREDASEVWKTRNQMLRAKLEELRP